jgi:hypothetical protein
VRCDERATRPPLRVVLAGSRSTATGLTATHAARVLCCRWSMRGARWPRRQSPPRPAARSSAQSAGGRSAARPHWEHIGARPTVLLELSVPPAHDAAAQPVAVQDARAAPPPHRRGAQPQPRRRRPQPRRRRPQPRRPPRAALAQHVAQARPHARRRRHGRARRRNAARPRVAGTRAARSTATRCSPRCSRTVCRQKKTCFAPPADGSTTPSASHECVNAFRTLSQNQTTRHPRRSRVQPM